MYAKVWGPVTHSEGHTSKELNGFCLVSNGCALGCPGQAKMHPLRQRQPHCSLQDSPLGVRTFEAGQGTAMRSRRQRQAAGSDLWQEVTTKIHPGKMQLMLHSWGLLIRNIGPEVAAGTGPEGRADREVIIGSKV